MTWKKYFREVLFTTSILFEPLIMKNVFTYLFLIFFAGTTVILSCKKERSCENCGDSNKPPIANAGGDTKIVLPVDSAMLSGSGSYDPDGRIVSWRWTKISGPVSSTIIKADSSKTITKNLVMGVYKFELVVTDNGGLSAKDTVQVIVDDPAVNQPPVANAGADQSISIPNDSTLLNGNLSFDPDGIIVSYQWTKISGPVSSSIINSLTAQTMAKSLSQGVYQFELKVTDNGGLTGKDTVQVVVSGAGANQPPIANAGTDHTITLPNDSTSLNGNLSFDPDGIIVGYQWTKISGPVSSSIINSSAVQTMVKSLSQGIYQFELRVTDNGGLSGKDTVQVVVSGTGVNQPPIANAGPDQSITLPVNTANLNGSSSSDPNNNITTYAWTKIVGPSPFNIINPNAVQTQVTNLVQGTYQFELKVTDAGALFDRDTVAITVNPASTNSHWTALISPPSYGTETFLLGIDANNVFIGDGYYHNFYKYNSQTNTWTQKANVPGQAYDYLVSFGVNGKGYTGMGYDLNTQHNEMYQYDPVSNQWIQKNNSPISGAPVSMVVNNLVYLVKAPLVWMYNPVSDSYTQKNNFPGNSLPFSSSSSFVINDIGYFISGTECWKYNTSSDTWLQKASLPGYLKVQAGFSSNNYGYVLGDSSQATYNLNYPLHLWRYDPLQNNWMRIYDDYPGYGAYLIKTFSLNGVVYAGFGYNNGDFPVGDLWRFQ